MPKLAGFKWRSRAENPAHLFFDRRLLGLPHPHHLYWPDLDVDVAVESIDHPERFPLVSQARPNKRMQPPRKKRARG